MNKRTYNLRVRQNSRNAKSSDDKQSCQEITPIFTYSKRLLDMLRNEIKSNGNENASSTCSDNLIINVMK